MLQGSTEKTAREIAIEQLNALAKSATLFEIKAAANYLVTNLSARSTKQILAVYENEISNLLGKEPNHIDSINCRRAITSLRNELPNGTIHRSPSSGILNAYMMVRLEEEQPQFAAGHTFDESTPLLFAGKKTVKRK